MSKSQLKKEFVYVVGDRGPEHNSIQSIHRNYKGAFKAWSKLRHQLLRDAKQSLKCNNWMSKEMYLEIIKNLSCKNPDKIDNYPQETPYILKMEIEN